MKCKHCEAELPQDAKICSACGAPVEEEPVAAAQPEAAVAEEVAAPKKEVPNKFATAGLLVSLFSIPVVIVFIFLNWICEVVIGGAMTICGVVLSILGLVFAKKHEDSGKGKSVWGMIFGLICFIVPLMFLINAIGNF